MDQVDHSSFKLWKLSKERSSSWGAICVVILPVYPPNSPSENILRSMQKPFYRSVKESFWPLNPRKSSRWCLQNGILMFPPPIQESNLTYIRPPCIRWPNWITRRRSDHSPNHHIHITITSLLLMLLLLLPADVHTAYCPTPGSNVGNVDSDTPALTILQWSPVAGEVTLYTGLTTNLQRLYTVYSVYR